MNQSLIDCLEALSPDVRRRIAAHHGLEDAEPAALARRLTDPVHLRSFARRMGPPERDGMDFFLFRVGEGVWTERERRKGEGALAVSPARFRVVLVRLRQWGFLYGLRRPWGETAYWCPPEMRAAWLELRREGPPSLPPATGDIRVGALGGCGVWHTLFHFLVLVDQACIPLTREGRFHRRWLKKLAVELEEGEDYLADTPWAGGEEPASVALAVDLARRLGLLREGGDVLRVEPSRLAGWLALSWRERVRLLYRLTRGRLLEARPDWDAVAQLMERHRSEVWVAVSDLLAEWAAITGGRGKRIEPEAVERYWLKPLCGLGWIDLGTSPRGTCWRWTSFAPSLCREEAEETGVVQPDFEVLIPPFFPLDRRWELVQFADYIGGERMPVYRIHAGSVERARERGMTEGEIFTLLERMTGGRVPANVAAGIRQWCRRAGRIVLRRVLLVEGEDEGVTEELEHLPELKGLILERIGPRALIADENQTEALCDRLRQLGYPPRKEQMPWRPAGALPDPRPWETAGEKNGYTVENRYPDLAEAVPEGRRLPRMWTSEIRSYHPATVQDMIRQAIRLRLDIRVRETDGSIRQFTPHRLENIAGTWMAEGEDGGRRVRIALNRIGGLQIRLPEGLG